MSPHKSPTIPHGTTKYRMPEALPYKHRAIAYWLIHHDHNMHCRSHTAPLAVRAYPFAELPGHRATALVRRKVDDFTAPRPVNIRFVFDAFLRLGEMNGVWSLRHKNGSAVIADDPARLVFGQSLAALQPFTVV